MNDAIECRCVCGAVSYSARSPLFRAYCHCTICQRFNDAPFADITFFRKRHVQMPARGRVEYRTLKRPPNVQRGTCVECGVPAIEEMVGMFVIVPTATVADESTLPRPSFHGFYHRRVADADDDLPKYEGFVRSQLAYSRALLGAMVRR